MSDHISGPRAIADPVTDITDVFAFPCPESPQHLVSLPADAHSPSEPMSSHSIALSMSQLVQRAEKN